MARTLRRSGLRFSERESFLDLLHLGPGLLWGWGWLALVGVVILFGLMLIPWFFFLLHLHDLLTHVAPENRRMRPGRLWLNYIPVFNLGWFMFTVIKVRESVETEFEAREWLIEDDLGYNVGLTAGILWVASFFIGWIPFFGWMLALAGIVCWIIYWLKAATLEKRLNAGPAWNPAPQGAVQPGRGSYVVRYPQGYVPPEARVAVIAEEAEATVVEAAATGPSEETTVAEDEPKPTEAAAAEGAAPPRERRKTQRRTGERRKRATPAKKPSASETPVGEAMAEAAPADAPDSPGAADSPAVAAAGERRGTDRRKTERRTRAPRGAARPAPAAPETDADGQKCKACGARHDEGDSFCRKCGSGLF